MYHSACCLFQLLHFRPPCRPLSALQARGSGEDIGGSTGAAPQAHFGRDAAQSAWDSVTQALSPQVPQVPLHDLAQQLSGRLQSLADRLAGLKPTGFRGALWDHHPGWARMCVEHASDHTVR